MARVKVAVNTVLLLLAAVPDTKAVIRVHRARYKSGGANITIEQFCPQRSIGQSPAILLLHGLGGVTSPHFPYYKEARALAELGYCVYLPRYLDAAHAPGQYPKWVQAILDAVEYTGARRIGLIGYSLGASVALATAAADPRFGAVVALSGSLPDEYFGLLTTLPPLLVIHGQDDRTVSVSNASNLALLCQTGNFVCDVQIYPREGHQFSASALAKAQGQIEKFLERYLPVRPD